MVRKQISAYTRIDRGKKINVSTYKRDIRNAGINSIQSKPIIRKQNYIPRSNPPGITKLKKPIIIKLNPKRKIKSGQFA